MGEANIWQPRKVVDISEEGLAESLQVPAIFPTVAAFKASLIELPDSKTVRLLDRGADFTKISGTNTGDGVIVSTSVNQSILLVPGSVITLKSIGMIGDGSDEWETLKEAFNFANSQNKPLLGEKGKTYAFTKPTGEVLTLQQSIDWGGATIVPNCEGEWLSIVPSIGKEEQQISAAALSKLQNDWEGTSVMGWDNSDPMTGAYFLVITDTELAHRISYSYGQNFTEQGVMGIDGNVYGARIYGLKGTAVIAKYKPMEDNFLVFENFAMLVIESLADLPSIYIKRNMVIVQKGRIIRETDANNYQGILFRPTEVYSFIIQDIEADSTGSGYGGNGLPGYLVQPVESVGIIYKNIKGIGRWGFTAGDWMKEVYIDNCDINRFDCHFGLGNLTVTGSNFYGWGVLAGSGDGKINVSNCNYYPQRSVGINAVDIAFYTVGGFVNIGSGSYGMRYRGEVSVTDSVIHNEYRVTSSGAAPSDVSVVKLVGLREATYIVNSEIPYAENPSKITLRNITSRCVDGYDLDRVDFVGVSHDTRGTFWDELFPLEVFVDNLSITNYNKDVTIGNISAYNAFDSLNTTDPARTIRSTMLLSVTNVNPDLPFDMGAIDETDSTEYLKAIQRSAFMRGSNTFGGGGDAGVEALLKLKVVVRNSTGSIYNSTGNYSFDIQGSVVTGARCRTIADLHIEDKNLTRSIRNCSIYPIPNLSGGSATLVVGDMLLESNIIKKVRASGQAQASVISGGGGTTAFNNTVDINSFYDQSAVDALWYTNTGVFMKVPTNP